MLLVPAGLETSVGSHWREEEYEGKERERGREGRDRAAGRWAISTDFRPTRLYILLSALLLILRAAESCFLSFFPSSLSFSLFPPRFLHRMRKIAERDAPTRIHQSSRRASRIRWLAPSGGRPFSRVFFSPATRTSSLSLIKVRERASDRSSVRPCHRLRCFVRTEPFGKFTWTRAAVILLLHAYPTTLLMRFLVSDAERQIGLLPIYRKFILQENFPTQKVQDSEEAR